MKKIINGKKYNTKTAELIFRSDINDGRSIELYKKRTDEFFILYITQWSNEDDWIKPISEAKAKEIIETYCDADVYEKLFGEVQE